MTGLVAKKMGIKEGSRAILINAPEEAVAAIGGDQGVAKQRPR